MPLRPLSYLDDFSTTRAHQAAVGTQQHEHPTAVLVDTVVGIWWAQKTGQRKHPLACEFMVGVRRFELLTSSVSGKRSPPELNAQICAAGDAARSILRENARVTQPSIPSFSRFTNAAQPEATPLDTECIANRHTIVHKRVTRAGRHRNVDERVADRNTFVEQCRQRGRQIYRVRTVIPYSAARQQPRTRCTG